MGDSPAPPGRIGQRQRVEIARSRPRIVDPLAQARPAVDNVDREHIVGIFIFEILAAPDRIVWIAAADRLEAECLHSPRSEGRREGKECVSTCQSRWSPYH